MLLEISSVKEQLESEKKTFSGSIVAFATMLKRKNLKITFLKKVSTPFVNTTGLKMKKTLVESGVVLKERFL